MQSHKTVNSSTQEVYWYRQWYMKPWEGNSGEVIKHRDIEKQKNNICLIQYYGGFEEEVILCDKNFIFPDQNNFGNQYYLAQVSDNKMVIHEGNTHFIVDSHDRKTRVYTTKEAQDCRKLVDNDYGVIIFLKPDDKVYTMNEGYLIIGKPEKGTRGNGLRRMVLSHYEYNEKQREKKAKPSQPTNSHISKGEESSLPETGKRKSDQQTEDRDHPAKKSRVDQQPYKQFFDKTPIPTAANDALIPDNNLPADPVSPNKKNF